MRVSHRVAIIFSGSLWLVIGVMLMYKGMNWIIAGTQEPASVKLLPILTPLARGIEQSALILLCVAIFVGFMKARFILAKTVKKVVDRIVSQPEPVLLTQAYGKSYMLVLMAMILLGLSMKVAHLPYDLRGLIDVTIGSALTQGSMLYFRAAMSLRKTSA